MNATLINAARLAVAQANPQPAPVETLINLLPWLLVFTFVSVLCVVALKGRRRQVSDHLERTRQHMAAVEAKLDRLIELQERRRDEA